MSIFSIGRIVKLAKAVSKTTYESIISPPIDMDTIRETISSIKSTFDGIFPRYLPTLQKIPFGVTFDTISKAYPNSVYLKWPYGDVVKYYTNLHQRSLQAISIKGRLTEYIKSRSKLWLDEFTSRLKESK